MTWDKRIKLFLSERSCMCLIAQIATSSAYTVWKSISAPRSRTEIWYIPQSMDIHCPVLLLMVSFMYYVLFFNVIVYHFSGINSFELNCFNKAIFLLCEILIWFRKEKEDLLWTYLAACKGKKQLTTLFVFQRLVKRLISLINIHSR